MVALLATLALALDRPQLDAAPEVACPPRPLRSGAAITPACDGVALSLARARWYAEMAEYADSVASLRELERQSCAAQLAVERGRADYWEQAATPRITPAGWFALGAGAGVATALLGALAVRAVAEAPLYQ